MFGIISLQLRLAQVSMIVKARRDPPDWCTTRLGRLQQDGDGGFRFIQRSFRLILWHHWGWKSIRGSFGQHKSSTFHIWPVAIFSRQLNPACLHCLRYSNHTFNFTSAMSRYQRCSSCCLPASTVNTSLWHLHHLHMCDPSSRVHLSICLHHSVPTSSSFTAWMG